MLKSVLAVVGGLIVTMILVSIGTYLAASLILGSPTADPTTPYLIANIVLSFLAASAGGYVTATQSPSKHFKHGLILAGIFLLLGLISAYNISDSNQPEWYSWLIPFVGATGVVSGAYQRTKSVKV